jgi:hypothetical protein
MHLSTRITRTVAAAMSVAALAVSIGAGSASAAPLDPVGPLNNGNVGYGTSWAGGSAVGSPTLDWKNIPLGSVFTQPTLLSGGNLYIENTAGVEARMQIVHYSDAAHSSVIATRDGGTKVGTGAFLNVFPINLGGVNSTSPHVHVNLQKKVNGLWTTVATSVEDL